MSEIEQTFAKAEAYESIREELGHGEGANPQQVIDDCFRHHRIVTTQRTLVSCEGCGHGHRARELRDGRCIDCCIADLQSKLREAEGELKSEREAAEQQAKARHEACRQRAQAERGRDEAIAACNSITDVATARGEKLAEMREKTDYMHLREVVDAGFKAWAEKQPKWFKKIDGTPIPNDLLVNILTALAEDFREARQALSASPAPSVSSLRPALEAARARLEGYADDDAAAVLSGSGCYDSPHKEIAPTLEVIDAALAGNSPAPSDLARLRRVVEDFRDHGVRHDLTPTIGGRIKTPDDVEGWYEYIASIDAMVRSRARQALSALDADEAKEVSDGS